MKENLKFKTRRMAIKIGVISLLVTSVVATTGSFVLAKKITVQQDERQIVVSGSLFQKVGSVLEKNGISLGDDYVVDVDADTFLLAVDEVEVLKKNTGILAVDGKTTHYSTGVKTVGELLSEKGIEMGELDRVEPTKVASLSEVTKIKLIRVEVSELPIQETVSYQTIEKENPNLEKGKTKVLQEGAEGLKSVVERVLFEDGKEIIQSTIYDKLLKEPVDEILEVGTKELLVEQAETLVVETPETDEEKSIIETIKSEPVLEVEPEAVLEVEPEAVLEVEPEVVLEVETEVVPEVEPEVVPEAAPQELNSPAENTIPEGSVQRMLNCTAYTATGNATALGVMPRSNHTIAAWSGLPFGAKVYIPAFQTTFTVEDRGGAVTEGIIDIYMDSYNECIQFGRQNLEAYITYP